MPFGLLPYASHSFWFGGTYYLGFEDDYDTGLKFIHRPNDDWTLHYAFYKNPEYASDSRFGRYSFDLVTGGEQRNSEINQLNFRGERHFSLSEATSLDLGFSIEGGRIWNDSTKSKGDRWAARSAALGATMYHWGLHPWAIYGVVALSLAFFTYNKGLPLTIRSTFYPLLGDRIWGRAGDVIDTLAVLATLFGLATSLGLGAQQAAGGMSFLFDISGGLNTQIWIIAAVTAVAVVSVIRGIDGGVKLLSNINMFLALVLLLFVIVAGSLAGFFTRFAETASAYAEFILPLSNPVGREDSTFYHSWTIFYWAWWISWSPFVGMFIARVSRGRTVRQFLVAVLLVPTIVTMGWMSAFGGNGLDQAQRGVGALAGGIGDSSLALFQMLAEMPLSSATSLLSIVLVLVFFITSSDSGSLVIDSITSGGKTDAPVPQRVFWATIEGIVAAVLLGIGGSAALQALQAGAVSTGLPFTFVLLAMCFSLARGLFHERKLEQYSEVIEGSESS